MSGRHRNVRALALLAMALATTSAMAGERTATLRVTVEVVASCSVSSATAATALEACSAPTSSRMVVEAAAAHPAPAAEPMRRTQDGSVLTVIY